MIFKPKFLILLASLLLGIDVAFLTWWTAPLVPVPELCSGSLLRPARPLDPAGLNLDDGTALASYLDRGVWTVIFVGYTACPHACPTTLAQLARAKSLLGSGAARVQALFLSVDPERDFPEPLARYTRHFDPEFRAATGPIERLTAFTSGLGSVFLKVEIPGGGYWIDHSMDLILVDPRGRLAGYLTPPFTPESIAADLGVVIARGLP